jgi:hypothetical protein
MVSKDGLIHDRNYNTKPSLTSKSSRRGVVPQKCYSLQDPTIDRTHRAPSGNKRKRKCSCFAPHEAEESVFVQCVRDTCL